MLLCILCGPFFLAWEHISPPLPCWGWEPGCFGLCLFLLQCPVLREFNVIPSLWELGFLLLLFCSLVGRNEGERTSVYLPTSDTSTPLFSGHRVGQLGGDVHSSRAFAHAVGEEPLFLEELNKITLSHCIVILAP